jgi:hypothetical protein
MEFPPLRTVGPGHVSLCHIPLADLPTVATRAGQTASPSSLRCDAIGKEAALGRNLGRAGSADQREGEIAQGCYNLRHAPQCRRERSSR